MARPRHPTHHRARSLAVAVLALTAAARLTPPASPAGAVVEHGAGFGATVLGWTSWYGGYQIGDAGAGWCIDHGSRAPDAAYGYAPTTVDDQSAETRTAIAWITGRAGPGALADPASSAAMMLAVHDLMGARYPHGPLDVGAMGPSDLAGFDGAEAAILDQARALRTEAVVHSTLVAPYALRINALQVGTGEGGVVTATLQDGAGAPVAGVPVTPYTSGATLVDPAPVTTADDGTARFAFRAVTGDNRFGVVADPPDLALHAFASTTVPAQRVAVPATTHVEASTAFTVAPPNGSFRIFKAGDATAYVPIAGAVFSVTGPTGAIAATVPVDREGASVPIALAPGRYHVVESTPPAGYAAAGPWEVEVTSLQESVLRVTDAVRRGGARIVKTDATTGAPLAGATLRVDYDADHDGTFETRVHELTSAEQAVALGDLLPGDYELREIVAPAGYQRRADAVRFTVPAGAVVSVAMDNQPVPTTTTTTSSSTTSTTSPTTTTTNTSPTSTRTPRPRDTVLGAPPAERPPLARTGSPAGALSLIGAGLVLLGFAVQRTGRGASRGQRTLPVWPSE